MLGQRYSKLRVWEHWEQGRENIWKRILDILIYFIFFSSPNGIYFLLPQIVSMRGASLFFLKAAISGFPPYKGKWRKKEQILNHKPEFSHHHFSIWSHQALSEKLPWDFLLFLAFLTEGRAFVFAFLKWNPLMWLSKIQHFHLGKCSNIFHRMTTKLQPPNPKIYS